MKRANRKIKKYLRKYISQNQDDWPEHLLMLEYIYNIRKSDGRSYISYQIMYSETFTITVKRRQRNSDQKENIERYKRKVNRIFRIWIQRRRLNISLMKRKKKRSFKHQSGSQMTKPFQNKKKNRSAKCRTISW